MGRGNALAEARARAIERGREPTVAFARGLVGAAQRTLPDGAALVAVLSDVPERGPNHARLCGARAPERSATPLFPCHGKSWYHAFVLFGVVTNAPMFSFGQAAPALSIDDVLLLIDSIDPITGARAQAMARLGIDLTNIAQPLVGNSDPGNQLGVIRTRLATHLQQAIDQDADDLYIDPQGLRFDLSHAFNAVNTLSPGSTAFSEAFATLKNISLAPVALKPVEDPAEKAFKVLSVLGSIAVAVGTAVALFTGRSKITRLLELDQT